MKDGYIPDEHWTSNLRTKAGHTAFTDERGKSSFTIVDTDGLFTTIIAENGYPDARAWRSRPPTWHLEVKSTRTASMRSSTSLQNGSKKYACTLLLNRFYHPSIQLMLSTDAQVLSS